ncbi:MAG: class I SAM-dependent methyltransferase [Spirochaetota bacterium]
MNNTDLISVPQCIVCGEPAAFRCFSKPGADGISYSLAECARCATQFLHPRPTEEETARYYGSAYFTKRTDRGYDNYFSPEIRAEIERVIALNLKGLGFDETFPAGGSRKLRSLDIGCAAGYFVNYLQTRGWDAQGIDISSPCTDFAQKKLSLKVLNGNYCDTEYLDCFDLITLWATIEHLHRPDKILEKAHRDLLPGGMIYISTCRAGGCSFMKLFGKSWRYYNFPEHLYFFTLPSLKRLLKKKGFTPVASFTYGSGFGKPKSALRRAADFCARRLRMGDMMVIAARKN